VVIRELTSHDFDEVHRAFVEAFSDYVVPMAPPRDRFLETLTRRGYVPAASSAVFENDRIVAFTLNGVDDAHAYDSGTGVVPAARRRGLARRTMEHSFELLAKHGCTNYTLEVIDSNHTAEHLYRKLGFRETRGLQSWTFDTTGSEPPARAGGPPPADYGAWWDCQPSWQNANASLARATDEQLFVGDEDSYAIVFPATGDLAQFAVRPSMRRKELGRRLLGNAHGLAGKTLRIMNVDESATSVAAFLESVGAKRLIRQLELVREL
jgi:ribosomal protein S18 acetylase RimI-like enzyme